VKASFKVVQSALISSPKQSYQLLAASCNSTANRCSLSASLLPRYTAYFSKRRSHAPAFSKCLPRNGGDAKVKSFPPLTIMVVVPGDPIDIDEFMQKTVQFIYSVKVTSWL